MLTNFSSLLVDLPNGGPSSKALTDGKLLLSAVLFLFCNPNECGKETWNIVGETLLPSILKLRIQW
jgi:hypothetical protein